jgi:hypothetical protein
MVVVVGSRKIVISPLKIAIFKKFNQQRNRDSPTVPLLVESF